MNFRSMQEYKCTVVDAPKALLILAVLMLALGWLRSSYADASRIYALNSDAARGSELLNGRYTGTLIVATPANIGVTDLSIQLDAVGSTFAGAVLAAGTTHFAGEPAISASISGSTNGITPTFTIEAQPFVEMIAGQTVTRTFIIEGEVLDDGAILTGDYHETIMGYTQTPLQITGTVLLARIAVGVPQVPTTPTPNPPTDGNFNLYLPLINRDTNSISASQILEVATPPADTPNEDKIKVYLPLITAD